MRYSEDICGIMWLFKEEGFKNFKMRWNLVNILIFFFKFNYYYLTDLNRLWIRNLGRDDRSISSNGKEVRFPFLNKNLI